MSKYSKKFFTVITRCFNVSVVDDAIRFVSGKSKEKVESMDSGNEDDKESSEPDYDEDKDQLEEEQEEQTGEITTTNQVF
jgi:hypothetical protein